MYFRKAAILARIRQRHLPNLTLLGLLCLRVPWTRIRKRRLPPLTLTGRSCLRLPLAVQETVQRYEEALQECLPQWELILVCCVRGADAVSISGLRCPGLPSTACAPGFRARQLPLCCMIAEGVMHCLCPGL